MGFLTMKKSDPTTDSIQLSKVMYHIRKDRIFLFQVFFQFSQPLADLAFLKHHFCSDFWVEAAESNHFYKNINGFQAESLIKIDKS
jgi:hypothetical protein